MCVYIPYFSLTDSARHFIRGFVVSAPCGRSLPSFILDKYYLLPQQKFSGPQPENAKRERERERVSQNKQREGEKERES